ncbi:protransforming growth factor alpha isoform X3 [Myotis daubentonii]|uniref:protransforming growth factor alpha isoform X3 n=1 Tax=Myotis daubentonii TaxID=98922 RepID=UPI002873EFDC|nr:protransforming growth factor alpha isoform X3 [Myotis daubentonii]
MGCWQEPLKRIPAPEEAVWVACGRRGPALKLKREVPAASGHKPLSELCLSPCSQWAWQLSQGRALPTQVLQARISCSLLSLRGHMFLEGLHRARLSKHNQGCRRSGHLGLRRLAVRGLDVHILAPQETLLAEGELEAMEIPKRQRMWPLEERAPASMPDLLNLSFGLISEAVTGLVLAVCQALENTTSALSANPPMAAAVVSYFNDCPDSHSQFCFHGTCRFLVQEDKPACVRKLH